ncbi:MAG: type II toxin-antitoxin system HicB family antitoxin [Candidatus Symbiodolus clandestinus]
MFNYPVKLQRDTQGAYLVTCRDLPDTVSGGNTQEQALEKVVSSLVKTVADYIEHRRPVPLASTPEKNEHVITLPILGWLKQRYGMPWLRLALVKRIWRGY